MFTFVLSYWFTVWSDTTVEPTRIADWLPHSPDLNMLYCYVRKERVHEENPERAVSVFTLTVIRN
jgi:hypothetical protein